MTAPPPSCDELFPAALGRPPEWDEEWARWLLGQYALVGITFVEADGGTVHSKGQYHGRVVEVNRSGITIACEGHWLGQKLTVPADQRAFQPARPGRYQLKATAEAIDDPDVLATWTMSAPSPGDPTHENGV